MFLGVVEITVGDEYPKFQFSQAAYVKEIAENSPLDTSIVLLSAVNHYEAIVVYSFVNGNSQQTFKINQQGIVNGEKCLLVLCFSVDFNVLCYAVSLFYVFFHC